MFKVKIIDATGTEPAANEIALLSFDPVTGWRVRACSKSRWSRPFIFRMGRIKLLAVRISKPIRPGLFCNPRKLLGV